MTADQPRSRKRARTGNGRGQATIREIAKEAGVSTATVSRVFNQPEKVRSATRERIVNIARERHFVFDGLAAGLASRRSRTLGLIIPTIMNSIYAYSTQAIHRTAQKHGYAVLVGTSEFSPDEESALVHRLLERRVDGLILTGATREESIYEKLRHNEVPFVITWRLTDRAELPSVSFDNYRAATTAVEHLISLGHRSLGLVCGRTDVNDRALDRKRAFEACLERHGLPVEPRLIFERDFEFIEGRAAMRQMLSGSPRPTAVFCANDIQAIGALAECREHGLRVPQDMSIMGFDDQPITQCTSPQLTSVRVPAAEMGERAAESLLQAIKTGEMPNTWELSVDLITRESTAPLR